MDFYPDWSGIPRKIRSSPTYTTVTGYDPDTRAMVSIDNLRNLPEGLKLGATLDLGTMNIV